ncbi:hypothetical protein HRH25_21065 [Flavisolibacter sp. BT320]|nr:hypothetical protein [Flavisolibacter longurius]
MQQMLQGRNRMDDQNKTATSLLTVCEDRGFTPWPAIHHIPDGKPGFYEMAIELEAIRNPLCFQRLAGRLQKNSPHTATFF